MVALSTVPEISISLAPPEEPLAEPFSPFSSCGPVTPEDSDSFRPSLLTPPPVMSPRFPRQSSPLRPADAPINGQGIGRERFEELLRASRERNANMGSKKSPDLRKEIAIKVHRSKQVERRALFLSKIHAPPSPSATLLPKTPPDSPAIFHFSLPSPGLESPLALFETLASGDPTKSAREAWVEQVEFHTPGQRCPKPPLRSAPVPSRKALPSLDQITARLTSQGHLSATRREDSRLPTFLKSNRHAPHDAATARVPSSPAMHPKARSALPPGVGRLHFPVRAPRPPSPEPELPQNEVPSPTPSFPPSPQSPNPRLRITTTVVPRTSSKSPIALTEDNLRVFSLARERTAQDMLKRLRRRTIDPSMFEDLLVAREKEAENKKLRRHSAPPELVLYERAGFTTPKLDLPGAF